MKKREMFVVYLNSYNDYENGIELNYFKTRGDAINYADRVLERLNECDEDVFHLYIIEEMR